MLSNQFKALTVVLLTMAVATPEMAVPAAAFLPAQVGSGGNSGLKLDNSNLLTEVGHRRRWRGNNAWPFVGSLVLGFGSGLGYGGGYGYGRGYRYYDNGNYGGGYRNYGGGGHVQWCLNRYRSYNPRTNLFMGYDGHRHRCNSPY